MLTKLVSLKVAAAAAVAALSVAGVAGAATGNLPDPAQRVAHRVLGVAGVPSPDDHASAANHSGQADHSPTGPDATGAAKDGLCRAWQSGQGGENGGKNDSTAFKALAAAAGGSDKIAAYCKDSLADHGQKGGAAAEDTPAATAPGQGQDHGAGSDQGAGSGQGAGSDGDHGQGQGQGQGQGAPPSTRPGQSH